MKKFLCTLAICGLAFAFGCESTEEASTPVVSPGQVSECGPNCEMACCQSDASLGAVNEKSECSGGVCPFSGATKG